MELEAFGTLGKFAVARQGAAGAPELAVWASGSSLAHAWRAEQLESLLPVSVGLRGADECTMSPGGVVSEWVAGLVRACSVGDGAPIVPGGADNWYGLLAGAYERRAAYAHPSADGPIVRVLGRLAADVRCVAAEYPTRKGGSGGAT